MDQSSQFTSASIEWNVFSLFDETRFPGNFFEMLPRNIQWFLGHFIWIETVKPIVLHQRNIHPIIRDVADSSGLLLCWVAWKA
jgi:hypothetical protein